MNIKKSVTPKKLWVKSKPSKFALQLRNIDFKFEEDLKKVIKLQNNINDCEKLQKTSSPDKITNKIDSLSEIFIQLLEKSQIEISHHEQKNNLSNFEPNTATYVLYYYFRSRNDLSSSSSVTCRPVGVFTGVIGWTPGGKQVHNILDKYDTGKLKFSIRNSNTEQDYLKIKTSLGQEKYLLTIANKQTNQTTNAIIRIYGNKNGSSGYAFGASHGSLILVGKLVMVDDLKKYIKKQLEQNNNNKNVDKILKTKSNLESSLSLEINSILQATTTNNPDHPRPLIEVEVMWGRLVVYVGHDDADGKILLLLHHTNNYRINAH